MYIYRYIFYYYYLRGYKKNRKEKEEQTRVVWVMVGGGLPFGKEFKKSFFL